MPQMGVSVAEGTIVAWHKQVGDPVREDETLCEISTDKIDSDLPAPASGTLLEILVDVEQTVEVGAVLARIATQSPAGEDGPELAPAAAPEPAIAGAPAAAPESAIAGAPTGTPESAIAGAPAATPEPAIAAARGEPRSPAPPTEHRHYSPVVLRIARREGIDLSQVPGSGRSGRVRKQDVLDFVHAGGSPDGNGNGNGPVHAHGSSPARAPEQRESPERPEPPQQRELPERPEPPQQRELPERPEPPQQRELPQRPEPPLHIESPYREPEAAQRSSETSPSDQPERLSRMRRSIAEHMVRSLSTAAHCTSIVEVDMSAIEAARAPLGLSYLPFIARCTIDALRAHPDLNATLEGETLTRHHSVDLGIAVSLQQDGLIVPVVRDAHELSHEGLARRIAELARRARSGELTADEVGGGSFTITNPGGYGTLASTPIINQPQVAILDLEAVVKRPVVVTDEAGRDSIAIRLMVYLCLSWDHRALDGAIAARFLSTLRAAAESWGRT
jgi:2-oxoglutarate dehydrogenase E2 component (dihydrolipoamide succinyltransferase)